MSSISLLGSINVCKVNTGYADKLQSDRFENPDNMLCPLWNGIDTFGRPANPDSFYTKNAGCNSSEDRVVVENFLRPQYMEYVSLDAQGFRNPTAFSNNPPTQIYEGFVTNPSNVRAAEQAREVKDFYKISGSAGYQYNNTNTPYSTGYCGVSGNPNCNSCSARSNSVKKDMYEGYDDRANRNFQERRNLSGIQSYQSRCNSCASGNAFSR